MAVKLCKPSDVIIPFHIPYPTPADITFIAGLENDILKRKTSKIQDSDSTSNQISSSWPQLNRVKMLNDRLKGRTKRLLDEFKAQGYNLLVGDYPDSLELMKCYKIIMSSENHNQFYRQKADRVVSMAIELESIEDSVSYIMVGASPIEINQLSKSGINNLLGRVDPTVYTTRYSTLSLGIVAEVVDSKQVSVMLISDSETSF